MLVSVCFVGLVVDACVLRLERWFVGNIVAFTGWMGVVVCFVDLSLLGLGCICWFVLLLVNSVVLLLLLVI